MNSQVVSINQAIKSKNAFILFVIFIPVSLFFKSGFASVAVLWFFLLCLINRNKTIDFKNQLVLVLPMILFLLYLISAFFSNDYTTSFDLILRRIHLLLIPLGFIIVNKTLSKDELNIVLGFFLVSCLICTLTCLFQASYNTIISTGTIKGRFTHYFFYKQFTSPVDLQPLYLSMFCNLSLLVTLQSTIFKNKLLKSVMVVYFLMIIFLLSSKIGMICSLFQLILYLINASRKKVFWSLLVGLTVSVVVISQLNTLRNTIQNSFKANIKEQSGNLVENLTTRIRIWTNTIETIKEKPFLGYGVGEGQKALEKTYTKNGFSWAVEESLNSHNEFLSTWLYLGMPGIFVLTVMMLASSIHSTRTRNIIALNFILMLLIFFCFESALMRQKGIVFFVFFYSLLLNEAITINVRNSKQ